MMDISSKMNEPPSNLQPLQKRQARTNEDEQGSSNRSEQMETDTDERKINQPHFMTLTPLMRNNQEESDQSALSKTQGAGR